MSTLPSSRQLKNLEQIMRLRTMKAQRAYSEKQEQWNEFKRIVDEMEANIEKLQVEINDVAQFKEDHKHDGNWQTLQDTSDRRGWLVYDQDQEQFYLGTAKSDLNEATQELAVLKTAWLQAQNREANIKDKGQLSVLAESEEAEALQETEIEDLQLQGGASHG